MPGHRVGDVVLLGGGDDDPRACAVLEADSHHAVTPSTAGRQEGLITMNAHLSVRQRGQVTVVKNLHFYLHL